MARLRTAATAAGWNKLALVVLTVVSFTTASTLMLVGVWSAVGASRLGTPCPACTACGRAAASQDASGGSPLAALLSEKTEFNEQQAGKEQQQQSSYESNRQQTTEEQPQQSSDAVPLLCGGPDAIPLVDAALNESTLALWPNAITAFRPWADKGFTMEDIEITAKNLEADKGKADIHMLVQVHNKKILFPRQNGTCPGCNGATFLIKEGLEAGMAAGRLHMPEGIPMLWNLEDFSFCANEGAHGPCKAPLFSVFKDRRDLDVLMPHFKPRRLKPHFVPWEQKRNLAFFRGAPICSYIPLNGSLTAQNSLNCSRWAIAQLSWEHPDLLNCTLMENVTQYGGPPYVEGPPTSHEEQTWYKYLVNADGSTAAWRLATLLMKNSLVIKQASPNIEYYYHAVKPCVHYMHYWVTSERDLVDVVRALDGPDNQLTAQRIAANGQAFALAHLTEEGQWRYWQLLIDRYMQLYRGPGGSGSSTGGITTGGTDGAQAAHAAAAQGQAVAVEKSDKEAAEAKPAASSWEGGGSSEAQGAGGSSAKGRELSSQHSSSVHRG